jgi:hypothetical protein
MQGEPETSNDSQIGARRQPVTITPNSTGEGSLPPPVFDSPDNGRDMMRQGNVDTAVVAPAYVYAIGQIEPRFPTLSVEKEFAQVIGRAETAGLSDRRALYKALSQRENRYLARELCWVFKIQEHEHYILKPSDPLDLDLLVATLRPDVSKPTDVDAVIGTIVGLASPDDCNGLIVPIVRFVNIYSFDVPMLIKAIPRSKKAADEEFADAEELFYRLRRMADNAGATDEHRALNYNLLRNLPQTVNVVIEASKRNCSLTAVDVRHWPVSVMEKIMEIRFSFTNRQTDVTEQVSALVNVTKTYPFLERQFSPTYDVGIGRVR